MNVRDLIPWGRNRNLPAVQTDAANPFLALHREMNRTLDDFARSFDLSAHSGAWWNGSSGWPHLEVSENEDHVTVVAELPGLDAKDVDVTLHDGVLALRGEKKAESQGTLYSERWQGQFQRSLQLGPDVDPDKVTAVFKNGVLTITVAKRPEAQRQTKRIPITAG